MRSYKMRNKLARLFYGRNGIDSLSTFLWWTGLVLMLLSSLLCRFIGTAAYSAVWAAGIVCIAFSVIRIFSKNISRRSAENARYLSIKNRFLDRFRIVKTRFAQRRDYKFFKCPDCKSILRVPRGKGKIYVTCRKCGSRFEAKS